MIAHPQNFPFPWGDPGPHVTHGYLCPPKPIRQMASRSVQPFLHQFHGQTHRSHHKIHRIGHIYAMHTMQPKNRQYICDDNSGKSWWILTTFTYLETERNVFWKKDICIFILDVMQTWHHFVSHHAWCSVSTVTYQNTLKSDYDGQIHHVEATRPVVLMHAPCLPDEPAHAQTFFPTLASSLYYEGHSSDNKSISFQTKLLQNLEIKNGHQHTTSYWCSIIPCHMSV